MTKSNVETRSDLCLTPKSKLLWAWLSSTEPPSWRSGCQDETGAGHESEAEGQVAVKALSEADNHVLCAAGCFARVGGLLLLRCSGQQRGYSQMDCQFLKKDTIIKQT